ncbi:MAG TPA: alpha/beta hydrolase-fold protein [Anaerolineales bacterium]|nr:alpha/beta hydrolase-fold protein [Anaerolineales bacterium]
MNPLPPDSRIERLRRDHETGGLAALEAFWKAVSVQGTPLVEPLPDEPDRSLVTFIWRGDQTTGGVRLHAAVDGAGEDEHDLVQLAGTDLWYAGFLLRNDYHAAYKFEVSGPDGPNGVYEAPDPFNPKTFIEPHDPERVDQAEDDVDSVIELPEAPPRPWTRRTPDAPSGTVTPHLFQSRSLGNERRIWIYPPPGSRAGGEPYDLLVVLDGRFFAFAVGAPIVLDYLQGERRIPPLAAVFVDNPGETWEAADAARGTELACRPAFAEILAGELLPWLRAIHPITVESGRTTLAGGSLGGLAAAHAVLERPDAFGNALSLSGSFWWRPEGDPEWEWLARRIPPARGAARRFFIEVGLLESAPRPNGYPGQLLANRHMRDVLQAAGHEVHYTEAMHGHDSLSWAAGLAEGLSALHGSAP